eukprot:5840094-Pleurochrysis_carterae.AAC.1
MVGVCVCARPRACGGASVGEGEEGGRLRALFVRAGGLGEGVAAAVLLDGARARRVGIEDGDGRF